MHRLAGRKNSRTQSIGDGSSLQRSQRSRELVKPTTKSAERLQRPRDRDTEREWGIRRELGDIVIPERV